MDESRIQENIEKKAEGYRKKYKTHINAFESNAHFRKVRPVTEFDIYALGKQLESFDELVAMCEADGTIGDMGVVPRIAHDVITVAYGSSIMPLICTVQPVEEEQGLVYYKDVKFLNDRGSVTAGTSFVSPLDGISQQPTGYAAATQTVSLGTGNGSTKTFTISGGSFPTSLKPIRPRTVSVVAGAISGVDDGANNIIGVGISGTVDYATGATSVTFETAPAGAVAITITFDQEVEAATDITQINYEFVSKTIRAKVYALKGTIGLLKSYALRKRFGTVAEDEIAIDLTNALNEELSGDLIRKLEANAVGSTTWYKVPQTGVSYFEHKQSFKDALATTEGVLVSNAKRGTISYLVSGIKGCAVMQTLPGFVKLYDGNSISGAHLYGTLDGTPIIRVPLASTLASTSIIAGFKGLSAFEAAACYSPYMPLTVTSVLPTGNPLLNQRAAAVMAATEVLVPNFLTMLAISETQETI